MSLCQVIMMKKRKKRVVPHLHPGVCAALQKGKELPLKFLQLSPCADQLLEDDKISRG